jgi:hypothetical protein
MIFGDGTTRTRALESEKRDLTSDSGADRLLEWKKAPQSRK